MDHAAEAERRRGERVEDVPDGDLERRGALTLVKQDAQGATPYSHLAGASGGLFANGDLRAGLLGREAGVDGLLPVDPRDRRP
jgi:hypothetical protein